MDDEMRNKLFSEVYARMFFVFCFFTRCEWWEFDPQAVDQKIKESAKVPIYAAAFHPSCHFCHGVAERFRVMADSVSLSRPVCFTAIDCGAHSSVCRQFGIGGWPAFLYIPRPEKHYWERPGYQDPEDWKAFIRRKLSSNLIDTTAATDDERLRMVEETLGGSTVFQMEISDEGRIASSNYESVSLELFNTSSKFLYRRVEDKGEQLMAHLGPECTAKTTDLTNVSEFVYSYKFSHFHRYKSEEWFEMIQRQNLTILFTDGKIQSDGMELLRLLSRQFCHQTMIGWAPIGRSSDIIRQVIGDDPPSSFLAFVTTEGCKYLHRGEITAPTIVEFVQNVVDGKENCVRGVPSRRTQMQEPVPGHHHGGYWLQYGVGALFISVALFLLYGVWKARITTRKPPGAIRVFKMR